MTMLIPVFLPILGAIALWRVPQDRRGLLNGGMLACLLASAAFALATLLGPDQALTAWRLTDRISIALKNDGVARFYMAFISVVWPAVGFYATGYNAHDPHLRRSDPYSVSRKHGLHHVFCQFTESRSDTFDCFAFLGEDLVSSDCDVSECHFSTCR